MFFMCNVVGIRYLVVEIILSALSIATGYGLDGKGVGVRFPIGARFLFSLHRPDLFWSSPSLLSNGYQGSFLGFKAVGP
jgi:hypothetical protein